jgi:perosamine synthetase
MSRNGATVAAFEREFAARVGAKYAIACANGTVTLQGALAALNVQPGDRVAVPPLTMAATTMAVLNVGAAPVFCDVRKDTWTIDPFSVCERLDAFATPYGIPVSLYGLHAQPTGPYTVDDAAQTLRPHNKGAAFTSYSMQASKILSTGEGGMLVTDSEELAAGARSYLSLGYRMRADQARIDPAEIKAPTYARHYLTSAINGRMNDCTAELGLERLACADALIQARRIAAGMYADVCEGVEWLVPQFVPEGWRHDMWTYAVACDTPQRAAWLADAVVRHGGERPYGAWRLTYQEPAFKHLVARQSGVVLTAGNFTQSICPTAESLQPRILQFATNKLASAARNSHALQRAIGEVG